MPDACRALTGSLLQRAMPSRQRCVPRGSPATGHPPLPTAQLALRWVARSPDEKPIGFRHQRAVPAVECAGETELRRWLVARGSWRSPSSPNIRRVGIHRFPKQREPSATETRGRRRAKGPLHPGINRYLTERSAGRLRSCVGTLRRRKPSQTALLMAFDSTFFVFGVGLH